MAMEKLIKLQEALRAKGYIAEVCETKEEAAAYIDSQIDHRVVGIGGSQTVAQMKLFDRLASHNEVFWHDEKPEGMTVMETRQAATRAEVYISSVNAISMDGVIVNIDNTGNRVAAISFGPDKVFLVIGENKVAEDYDSALFRARNVAAPKNAKRLNRKTPCALTGDKCYDCKSPERICRNLSVLWNRPAGIEYHVVLINEELGY